MDVVREQFQVETAQNANAEDRPSANQSQEQGNDPFQHLNLSAFIQLLYLDIKLVIQMQSRHRHKINGGDPAEEDVGEEVGVVTGAHTDSEALAVVIHSVDAKAANAAVVDVFVGPQRATLGAALRRIGRLFSGRLRGMVADCFDVILG